MQNIWARDIDPELPIWRYFRPHRFVEILNTSQLYFAAAKQFSDPFEGAVAVLPPDFPIDPRYPELSSMDRAFGELRRLTKISCWHVKSSECAAMWHQYGDQGKGVALRTTVGKLVKACRPFFCPNARRPEDTWYGLVSYVDLLSVRLRPRDTERFFYKHSVFESEQEFRLVISLASAEEFGVPVPVGGILVEVSLSDLIQDIFIGPNVDGAHQRSIEEVVRRTELKARFIKSSLLGSPRYV
jgi:hypothetical protein